MIVHPLRAGVDHDSYGTHNISLEVSQHERLIQFRLTEGAETRSGPTRTARTHGRRAARAFTSMTNVPCVPSLFRLLCPKSVTVEIYRHRVMVPLQAPLFGLARPTFSNSQVMGLYRSNLTLPSPDLTSAARV